MATSFMAELAGFLFTVASCQNWTSGVVFCRGKPMTFDRGDVFLMRFAVGLVGGLAILLVAGLLKVLEWILL